jgi:hypothetical protein
MDKRKAENMDDREYLENEIRIAKANLGRAKKAMEKASAARMSLPPGSSRARVTTANARLNTYCEAVARWEKKIDELYHKLVNMTTWE